MTSSQKIVFFTPEPIEIDHISVEFFHYIWPSDTDVYGRRDGVTRPSFACFGYNRLQENSCSTKLPAVEDSSLNLRTTGYLPNRESHRYFQPLPRGTKSKNSPASSFLLTTLAVLPVFQFIHHNGVHTVTLNTNVQVIAIPCTQQFNILHITP